MRFSRLALVIVASGAAISIPAYAVVDLGAKAGGTDGPVYLMSDPAGAGVIYQIGSSYAGSSLPWPGSGSGFPWPGSGSSMFPNPSAVPEVSTWMMLVMGFFAVGAIRYRAVRRSRAKPE